MAMDAREMSTLPFAAHGHALHVVAGLAIGAVTGAFNYLTLWWNARLFATRGSAPAALAVQFARLALMAAPLALIARLGALPLLAAMLGIVAARSVVVPWLGAHR